MINYFIRKALYGLAVLIGIVVIVFFLFNILPGDPAKMTMGQRADVASLEAVKKEFGLDQPPLARFALFINDLSPISVIKDDSMSREKYSYTTLFALSNERAVVMKTPYLRRSYQTKKLVSDILWETAPNTAILALSAMFFATTIGIVLGVIAALNKDTWIDKLALSSAVLGISLPSFFAGIIIAWIFGFVLSNYTGLNISGSLYDYDPFAGQVIVWKNLILPAFTLGIRPLAIIVQLTRVSLLDVMSQDYIRTARAKGLNNYTIITKHALKNALNPVVTAVSGWLASLMAGAFFIEYIFGWNGLGKATVDALELADFPVVMGSVLFVATIFVAINILVDLVYGWLDPRIRV